LNTHAFSIYVLSAWGIEGVKCSQHLPKLRILLLSAFIKITTRLRTSKLTSLQVREHTLIWFLIILIVVILVLKYWRFIFLGLFRVILLVSAKLLLQRKEKVRQKYLEN